MYEIELNNLLWNFFIVIPSPILPSGKKIIESNVEKIYLALDDDTLKDALKHAETFIGYGKRVYFIEMEGKDPNELGFNWFFVEYNEQTIDQDFPQCNEFQKYYKFASAFLLRIVYLYVGLTLRRVCRILEGSATDEVFRSI